MQPKEILVIDIAKPEEELLAQMKAKTRYNIRLAIRNPQLTTRISSSKEDIDEFLRLIKITSQRNKITAHPESYYRKMMEVIPKDILRLYIAEFEGKTIVTNVVIHYGNTATYLHGASDDKYKNVMAPYLLQWKQIQDATSAGCAGYDFGGVKTEASKIKNLSDWTGITRFKIGFSPQTKPIEFPGSYDIVINRKKYYLYAIIQGIRRKFKN